MNLQNNSIIAWIYENQIKTEKGLPFDLKNHFFLYDILRDFSPYQVMSKAAQLGMTVTNFLKMVFVIKNKKFDGIYTLPTDTDAEVMVGGKFNRIIKQNPIIGSYTRDKDTVEQKQIGDNMLYFRGTFSKKAAISVTSDINIHDEVDFSDMEVIDDYESRLQHSQYGWIWKFGHPSAEETGVDIEWRKSDQRHWFIKCSHCNKRQYMSWPESIDKKKGIYICKFCKKELSDEDRRIGEWIKKYRNREWSGYWIPLLIAPWVSAKRILKYKKDKGDEYFYNRVLGLPYVGAGNKLSKKALLQNLIPHINTHEGRIVIGMDTGTTLWYVIGNETGIFYYGYCKDYDEIKKLLKRWPKAILVIDQGGDLIHPRELREEFKGRVFLCTYSEDRKTMEMTRWGKGKEAGGVIVDRNRMIDLIVGEFTDKRIPLCTTDKDYDNYKLGKYSTNKDGDYYDYWVHWNNVIRTVEETDRGFIRKTWKRTGPDHLVHATVYWRVGMSRFAGSGSGKVFGNEKSEFTNAPIVLPGNRVIGKNPNPTGAYFKRSAEDWRNL